MSPLRRARALPVWIGVAALAVASASLSDASANATSKATFKQLGFNSYVQDLCQSNATWASDAKGQFSVFKSLGANTVALAFPLYMSSLSSDVVYAQRTCGTTFETPSTARLAVAIKEAHALHLRVFLRPMLDETVFKAEGGWRGVIRPVSVRAWFRTYLATLTPYLKLAQQQHVEYFAISTELDSMAKKVEWPSTIATAKRYYKGSLIFTITWRPNETVQPRTAPGMDAYQAVLLPPSATPSQLLAGWNAAVTTSNQVPFPLSSATLDEVAINAQDGAYHEPWAWGLPPSDAFDQNVQANWFSMACSFFKTHNMQGIYFWGIWYADGANAMPATPSPSLAQEIQPASAAVIKSCYTGK
jgi:Glycoside Hydrolase Family 113